MSWLGGLIAPAVFSGIGYYAAGLAGVIVGTPLIVAFGLGRRGADRDSKKTDKCEKPVA
jgi:hypothetical protein